MNTLHFVLLNLTQHSRFLPKCFWLGEMVMRNIDSRPARQRSSAKQGGESPQHLHGGAQTGLVPLPSPPAEPWLPEWRADCLFDLPANLPGGSVINPAVRFAYLLDTVSNRPVRLLQPGCSRLLADRMHLPVITSQLDCSPVVETGWEARVHCVVQNSKITRHSKLKDHTSRFLSRSQCYSIASQTVQAELMKSEWI